MSSVTFVYILASLRGSSLCLYSGCYGGAVLFRDFAYILASLRGSSLCLYSGCYGGAVVFRNFCLYSGVAEVQQPLSIFWLLRRSGSLQRFAYILASLRGSSLCLYSGCGGGLSSEILRYSGVAEGKQPLSIFWLLWRSSND